MLFLTERKAPSYDTSTVKITLFLASLFAYLLICTKNLTEVFKTVIFLSVVLSALKEDLILREITKVNRRSTV